MTETSFEFNEVTTDQLQEEMQSGRQTARSIAEHYLDRIERLNRQGPSLRAVIELNPDVLAIAEELDREREQGGPRGPLHGIPVLLKDNIDTADRMSTTAGSLALEGSTAPEDAFLVQRLRMAGGVILGKANLSEWANFRSTHPVSGWSARGGQTRNPYALDRNPCGSSSGSAVAVAANLCALAVGTETDGSIVCPSAVNGIVGIKPTLGLVSRNGVVPIAHSQDTAGPMARTVRDATLLLNVLAGSDTGDPATLGHSADSELDYTKYLKSDGLRGARLGIARQYFGSNSGVDRLIDDCITEMKRQGADNIDPVEFASYRKYDDSELEVMLYEFKNDLASYLRKRGDSARVKSLADIIAFNEERRSEEMPYFEQEIMLKAEKKSAE